MLIDASSADILRAVRHRISLHLRRHRLAAAVALVVSLGLVAWSLPRLRRAYVRRKQRKAQTAISAMMTHAAAKALLARPASPDALADLSMALARSEEQLPGTALYQVEYLIARFPALSRPLPPSLAVSPSLALSRPLSPSRALSRSLARALSRSLSRSRALSFLPRSLVLEPALSPLPY